jgi:microcystin-dependent protein
MPDISKPSGINNRWAQSGLKSAPDVSKIDLGWEVEKPPYQVQNWLDNRQDNFNAHVNQHGIPYWDSETEYQANKSYVVDPISGIVYRCLVTNTNQSVNNLAYWDIAFSPYEAMVPTGSTQMFAGTSTPRGWLIADGTAVSRTTYAALFAVIGTTYGSGDGSATFNLPDMRGVVVRGADRGRNLDPSRVQGSYQGDLFASHNHPTSVTVEQTGEHTHTVNGHATASGEHTHNYQQGYAPYILAAGGGSVGTFWSYQPSVTSLAGSHTHGVSGTANASGQHTHLATASSSPVGGSETRMKNIAMLGIIKF